MKNKLNLRMVTYFTYRILHSVSLEDTFVDIKTTYSLCRYLYSYGNLKKLNLQVYWGKVNNTIPIKFRVSMKKKRLCKMSSKECHQSAGRKDVCC